MDMGNLFTTDLIFTQCESPVRVVGVAVSKAVAIAKATVVRASRVDGTVGEEARQILEQVRASAKKGNIHLTLDGEKRLGPPPIVQPIKALFPDGGELRLNMTGLSPISMTQFCSLQMGYPDTSMDAPHNRQGAW